MDPILVPPAESPYLVGWDGSFRVKDAPTAPPKKGSGKKKSKRQLEQTIARIPELQRRLYADDRYAVLLVFQAMDAAGKDGTIRAVMSGIDPTGTQVFSFKQPSEEEKDHDFLWRIARSLPEQGRIGIFNRSHYEEVLIVRVHPEFLDAQKLPREDLPLEKRWAERYDSIRDFERHLARNGTVILKFWLNVSFDEQRQRFLDRIDDPDRHWKFSPADVEERKHWKKYMRAYEDALNETSRPWAPWYAVPADGKPFMRSEVARIVVETLDALPLRYPEFPKERKKRMNALGKRLRAGKG